MTIHNAVLEVGGEVFNFSSLDGETWLPVTRPAIEGEEERVTSIAEGDGQFTPPTHTRAYLEELGAVFTTTDSQTENREEI